MGVKSVIWIVFIMLITGCDNPVELHNCQPDSQIWLTDLIDQYKTENDQIEINSYSYRGQIVISIEILEKACDFRNTVYDCYGNIICQFRYVATLNDCHDFTETATDKKLIL